MLLLLCLVATQKQEMGGEGNEEESVAKAGPRLERHSRVLQNFRVVVRAIHAHSSWIEKQCGLPASQLWALWEVFKSPGLRVSEVAKRLAIRSSTASNLLDKIEAKGLVIRERTGLDQRVVKLYPTETGSELLRTAPRPAEGALTEALGGLSDRELAALDRSFQKLVARLPTKESGFGDQPLLSGDE